jgi:hypothetical protein
MTPEEEKLNKSEIDSIMTESNFESEIDDIISRRKFAEETPYIKFNALKSKARLSSSTKTRLSTFK